MNRFTFICEEGPGLIHGHGPETKTSITFKAVQLDEILAHFELFLKGCGFNNEGTLDFVNDFDDENPDGHWVEGRVE